jgi:hypothetical protein
VAVRGTRTAADYTDGRVSQHGLGYQHRAFCRGFPPGTWCSGLRRGQELFAQGAPAWFNEFFGREAWRFVFVQQVVAELGATAVEFPPMQDPASFNLSAVKAKIDAAIRARESSARMRSNIACATSRSKELEVITRPEEDAGHRIEIASDEHTGTETAASTKSIPWQLPFDEVFHTNIHERLQLGIKIPLAGSSPPFFVRFL